MRNPIHATTAPSSSAATLARLLIGSLLVIAVANATLFTYSATTPLVAKDSWYFLDTFVREYFNYSLDIRDFFTKRGADDHAQPLHRLILLFHLRNFGLDFTVEALIGIGFGVISALLALLLVGRAGDELGHSGRRTHAVAFALCAGAIPVLMFSLNSWEVFTWSLVTLGFMLVGLAIAYFWLGAGVLATRVPAWAMLPASFLVTVVLDSLGGIYAAAFVLLCVATALLRGQRLLPARAAAYAIAGVLVHKLGTEPLLAGGVPAAGQTQLVTLGYLQAHWMELWKIAWLPVQSMFVNTEQLQNMGPAMRLASSLLAMLLIALHALFWLRAAPRLREGERVTLVCSGLLLCFYGILAALLVTRVSRFGFDYLGQPRYYVAYLLGSLPILISAALAWRGDHPRGWIDRGYRIGGVALALGILSVQWPVATNSWERFKYISEYSQRAAYQLGQLRDAPDSVSQCVDILFVCDHPTERKKELVHLLVRHELNIFNRSFQLRHRLYPDEAAIPAPPE